MEHYEINYKVQQMKSQFSLALLASISRASSLPQGAQPEFLSWAGKFNKNYRTTEDVADRIGIWLENKA